MKGEWNEISTGGEKKWWMKRSRVKEIFGPKFCWD